MMRKEEVEGRRRRAAIFRNVDACLTHLHIEAIAVAITMATAFLPGSMAAVKQQEEEEMGWRDGGMMEGWRESEGSQNCTAPPVLSSGS